MKRAMTIVTVAAVWGGLVSFGVAEDQGAGKSPDPSKVEVRTTTASIAGLRAEIHRTLAALIEARAVDDPDEAKVAELTERLQQLRGRLRAQTASATRSVASGSAGAMGGGMGYGRGGAWGRPGWGRGFGPGAGRGFGPAAGRGWGGGAGGGRGLGPGAGQGLAPGGAAFVDRDNDGVCDNYELRQGMHK